MLEFSITVKLLIIRISNNSNLAKNECKWSLIIRPGGFWCTNNSNTLIRTELITQTPILNKHRLLGSPGNCTFLQFASMQERKFSNSSITGKFSNNSNTTICLY